MANDILVIDGTTMPSPTVYTVGHMDLDSSDTYRSEVGVTQRDRIRQGVRKISLEWLMLTAGEIQIALAAIKKPDFPVTFLDPELGIVTKRFYVGDRNPMTLMYNRFGQERWSISYNLIEM